MEFNVAGQIKNYWNKIIGLSDNEPNEEFADATSEHSVRASKFLMGLNLDPVMPEINKYYAVDEGGRKVSKASYGEDNDLEENQKDQILHRGRTTSK